MPGLCLCLYFVPMVNLSDLFGLTENSGQTSLELSWNCLCWPLVILFKWKLKFLTLLASLGLNLIIFNVMCMIFSSFVEKKVYLFVCLHVFVYFFLKNESSLFALLCFAHTLKCQLVLCGWHQYLLPEPPDFNNGAVG